MKPAGTWPPAGATVYSTGAASGQQCSHGYPGAHAHCSNAADSSARIDHSPKDLGISADQPELQQVQTQ